MAKIIVISQDLEIIETTTRSLKDEGHDVSVCDKPAEVVSIVKGKDFDLVFIDVRVRDVQYEKIAELIRSILPDAEIVSITSYAFPYVSTYDTSHVMSYLVQPLTDDKIRNVVNRALRQAMISRERRRLLSNVTAAKKQWEATVDAIDDPIFLTDFEYNVLRANLMTYRMLGKGVDKVLGAKCYEIFHCAERPPGDCPGKRATTGGAMVSDVMHFKGLGERLSCDVYPQVFAGGGLVHHLHAPVISYETQTELMTTYEHVFDESLVPILLIDVEDYKVVDANRRALEFLVREPGMIFNMALANLFVPVLSERAINSLMERLRNRGGSFRSKIVDGRGREKDVHVIANPVNVRSKRLAAIMLISVELL
ncbi:MAG: PAS domain-containing protein [candidate division WOR-3 bacterium]|nr:MAG: PAS domain-containing protein [candidate division WOR-3 bacterium]